MVETKNTKKIKKTFLPQGKRTFGRQRYRWVYNAERKFRVTVCERRITG
jgi:hypothetical protein